MICLALSSEEDPQKKLAYTAASAAAHLPLVQAE